MTPFALLPKGRGIIIHVSGLAAHTRDMLANPAVSLLIVATPATDTSPLALPRVSVQGRAQPCPAEHPGHAEARACYLAKFPESAPMFSFADFMLFLVEVRTARLVAGFGRARTLTAEQFAAACGG